MILYGAITLNFYYNFVTQVIVIFRDGNKFREVKLVV